MDDVQHYKDELIAIGKLKGATINRRLAYLSAFFTWAQLKRYVPTGYNPASAKVVKREREPWRSWIILTPEQREKLWAALPPQHQTRAKLLFHLGVRRDVVLNLQWEQVDWASDLITYTSKGKSGVIPMNKTARVLLEKLAAEQGFPKSGPVYPVKALSTFIRHWDKARKSLGLPTLRRHDLGS
jgi:integrase